MTKRDQIVAHMRVAGLENDRKAWTRLYVEHRISLAVAEQAWREGQALRRVA